MKKLDDKIIGIIMSVFKFFQRIIHHVRLGDFKQDVKSITKTEHVKISVNDYPPAAVKIYYPNQEFEKLPLIVYIHGGGWSAGSEKEVSNFAKLFAQNGYVVANIDYSLAPKYPYPVAINQIIETINHLIENSEKYKIDNNKIFISGHSAGAHLAAQVGLIASNEQYRDMMNMKIKISKDKIKGLLLFSGVYNIETVSECNFPGFELIGWSYTKTKKFMEYKKIDELSIINYITSDYPNCFITVGNNDKLAKQSYELTEKLKEENISYTTLFWDNDNTVNLGHHYIYNLKTVAGKKFYNKVVDFLKQNSK